MLTGARRATIDELDQVVEVLTASHLDYAWERWALPWDDRSERLTRLYQSDVGTLAFSSGEVWITECRRSAAVWLPGDAYDQLGPHERRALDASARSAFGERISIIDEVENAVAAQRPPADWHLATMGTLPDVQRTGLGTAALQPRLTALDRAHSSAVLETSEPGNLEFYGRLGFEIVAELAQLPHSAPTTWIMRRST
jgi:GNAT superfamily N-acetyltransferase